MTFIEFLKLLPSIISFGSEIKALIGLLQKTPSEKRQELMNEIESAFDEIKKNKDTSRLSDIINGV
jgi:hypothetical protein